MCRGDIRAQQLGHFRANDLVRIDCNLRRGGLAGADGPHRLIRNDDGRGGFGRDCPQSAPRSASSNLRSLACFALCKHFANANNWNNAVLQRGMQLLVDDLVGLGKILPPLRVADQRMRSAHGQQAGLRKFRRCKRPPRQSGCSAQPTATLEPLAASITVGSNTGEGNRAISSRVCPATSGKKASTNALASAGVLYIFQLAAISALRGMFDEVLDLILADGN